MEKANILASMQVLALKISTAKLNLSKFRLLLAACCRVWLDQNTFEHPFDLVGSNFYLQKSAQQKEKQHAFATSAAAFSMSECERF